MKANEEIFYLPDKNLGKEESSVMEEYGGVFASIHY